MAKECIDREAGLTELCRGCSLHSAGDNFFCGSACPKYERVAAIPAADVRPVVRGKWIWTVDDDEYLGEYWKCNLCGEHSYIGYNYCPDCGADMREE